MTIDLNLCNSIIARAKALGASDAVCQINEGRTLAAESFDNALQGREVNLGTSLSVTVYFGQKVAEVDTTDLTADGIEAAVQNAVRASKDSSDDKYAGLADPSLYRNNLPNLDLFDPKPPTATQLGALARALEDGVRSVKGITSLRSAKASVQTGRTYLAISNGFAGVEESSLVVLYSDGVAERGNSKVTDSLHRIAVYGSDLADPYTLGQEIGRISVAKLNQGKLPRNGVMPVVLSPDIAKSLLLGNLVSTLGAEAIADGKVFINQADLGKKLFSSNISIIDAWNIKRGPGSRLFTGSGVSGPEELAFVRNGVLENLCVGVRGGRKTGLTPNGRGSSNLWLENGSVSVADLVSDIKEGFYVTDLMGHGYRGITGDIAYSAGGYLIRNGQITDTYVLEAAIAGNLRDMLQNATPANDLQRLYSANAPTVRVEGITVSGK